MGANVTTPQKWGKKSWFEVECFFSFSFFLVFFFNLVLSKIWQIYAQKKKENSKINLIYTIF
jgi:hypothetical protein